jgi:hypothetical protein
MQLVRLMALEYSSSDTISEIHGSSCCCSQARMHALQPRPLARRGGGHGGRRGRASARQLAAHAHWASWLEPAAAAAPSQPSPQPSPASAHMRPLTPPPLTRHGMLLAPHFTLAKKKETTMSHSTSLVVALKASGKVKHFVARQAVAARKAQAPALRERGGRGGGQPAAQQCRARCGDGEQPSRHMRARRPAGARWQLAAWCRPGQPGRRARRPPSSASSPTGGQRLKH